MQYRIRKGPLLAVMVKEMALDLVDFETRAKEAVMAFWGHRELARQTQVNRGKLDNEEGSSFGIDNMDGFLALMKELVLRNGLQHEDIHLARRVLTLPGHSRPTKQWDMLVINEGRLVAALDLKSQIGPLFGDGSSKRAEAIATAHDLWSAYREGAFGKKPPPFVGSLMLLEDCPASRTPTSDQSPHFSVLSEFEKASYADRYNILCRKLVQELLYTEASVILSPRTAVTTGEYSELSELTGLRTFVAGFAAHIAGQAVRNQ